MGGGVFGLVSIWNTFGPDWDGKGQVVLEVSTHLAFPVEFPVVVESK